MKKSEHIYFNGTTNDKYELEACDFDYVSNEFITTQDSLGISLQSISNPKLSIHLGKYDIKYDNDISARRMFIATERVCVKMYGVCYHIGSDPNWFKKYIPTTTEQLYKLICEYRYEPMDSVTEENIINFLQ